MFEDYFVTTNVAVALRKAGFDEPCMAAHEYYTHEGKEHHTLIINYNNQPVTPEIYNSTIQHALAERPGLFEERLRNSQLQPWLYAAPLYQQVFDWFETKNIYLHDYTNPHKSQRHYGVNVYDEHYNCIWPTGRGLHNYIETMPLYLHLKRRDAWEQAILEVIKIVPNE